MSFVERYLKFKKKCIVNVAKIYRKTMFLHFYGKTCYYYQTSEIEIMSANNLTSLLQLEVQVTNQLHTVMHLHGPSHTT